MRRPLFMVCLCLVVTAACRLLLYDMSDAGGSVQTLLLADDGEVIAVTGRVCRKNTQTFLLDSVVPVVESNSWEHRNLQSEILSEQNQSSESTYHNFLDDISIKTKILCEYSPKSEELCYGSTVVLEGTFHTFAPSTNPGEFNAVEYYGIQGIGGKLTDVSVHYVSDGHWAAREFLYRLRSHFRERLYTVFPQKEASILTAMLLGDKEDLDGGIKELYKQSGIVHILSISGLHITMIGMGIYKLLRRIGVPIWLAAVCGGVVLCLYGVMTGMSVSACRAIGMYLIRMLAVVVGKSYEMLTALGVLAAVMVLHNPLQLKNAGFLLSFGSVLGVGWIYPSLFPEKGHYVPKRYEPRAWKRMWDKLWWETARGLLRSISAGGSVMLFTLPIQLWFYYEVPTYSVFLNLLILPFMGIVMMTGMVTMLLPGTGVVGTPAWMILKGYEWLCCRFQQFPFHTWNPGRPGVWQVVVYYLLLTVVVFLKTRRRVSRESMKGKRCGRSRRMRLGWEIGHRISVPVMLTVAVMIFAIRLPAGNTVTVLDVGQGDCIVIETASGEVYLFDCGSSSKSRVGEYILLPYLKYKGIRRVDAVFVSHSDTDHCSGIKELLAMAEEKDITIGQLVLPGIGETLREEEMSELLRYATEVYYGTDVCHEAAEETQLPIAYIEAGDSFSMGSASFLCLHPPFGYETADSNEYSQCLYVELRDKGLCDKTQGQNVLFSLLFTGDVEGEGEELLLQELKHHDIRDVTMLKVAHHGSRNSTGKELLAQVRPKVAVISCGENNRYGHPHEETLNRLVVAGTEICRTDQSGAIIVESIRDKGRIIEYESSRNKKLIRNGRESEERGE